MSQWHILIRSLCGTRRVDPNHKTSTNCNGDTCASSSQSNNENTIGVRSSNNSSSSSSSSSAALFLTVCLSALLCVLVACAVSWELRLSGPCLLPEHVRGICGNVRFLLSLRPRLMPDVLGSMNVMWGLGGYGCHMIRGRHGLRTVQLRTTAV